MDRWVRVAGVAGIVAGVAWAVKEIWLLAVGVEGPVDVTAFFVGMLGVAVCASGAVVALLGSRPPVVRALGAIVGALLGVVLVPLAATVSAAAFGEGPWAGSEAGIVTLGVAAVVVGVVLLRREPLAEYRPVSG